MKKIILLLALSFVCITLLNYPKNVASPENISKQCALNLMHYSTLDTLFASRCQYVLCGYSYE